jgi:hypothetical protein
MIRFLQKEIVEWVLVEVLKILFTRMLLRKFQNVSTSYKSISNMAFPFKTVTNKSKLASPNQKLANSIPKST